MNRRIGASDDLQDEVLHAPGLEGVLEGGHLVQDASHGPQVGLVVVRLILADLRAQVVRRPDTSFRKLGCPVKNPSDAEVSELNNKSRCDKNILSLDVTVENVTAMDVVDSETELEKNE